MANMFYCTVCCSLATGSTVQHGTVQYRIFFLLSVCAITVTVLQKCRIDQHQQINDSQYNSTEYSNTSTIKSSIWSSVKGALVEPELLASALCCGGNSVAANSVHCETNSSSQKGQQKKGQRRQKPTKSCRMETDNVDLLGIGNVTSAAPIPDSDEQLNEHHKQIQQEVLSNDKPTVVSLPPASQHPSPFVYRQPSKTINNGVSSSQQNDQDYMDANNSSTPRLLLDTLSSLIPPSLTAKYTLPDKTVASQVLMYRQLLHTACKPGLRLSRPFQGTTAQRSVMYMPW